MDLNTIWFILLAILIIGYAILDGFDLGVGVLHLFARDNDERRIHINAIGPVWDGNEVWLLTAGGALFAAFPSVYATAFSSFYLALVLLLTGLIFRAVSMEFRAKVDSPSWRKFWDWSFGLGSFIPALLFGVAVGNLLRGLPISITQIADKQEIMFKGSFLGLLNPYSLLIGVFSLVMLTMHGAVYLALKSTGDLNKRMQQWIPGLWMAFVILYIVATIATFFVSPYLFERILNHPLFWILLISLLASIVYIPVAVKAEQYFKALLASSTSIASIIGLGALSMFPRLIPSILNLDTYSLTAYRHSSSELTLTVMLIIALIGMPLVLAYTFFIYRIFKGKVYIGDDSY